MSIHNAESYGAGLATGEADARAGRPQNGTIPSHVKARDGYSLIHDEQDANAYKSGYIRGYHSVHGDGGR